MEISFGFGSELKCILFVKLSIHRAGALIDDLQLSYTPKVVILIDCIRPTTCRYRLLAFPPWPRKGICSRLQST